MEREGTLGTLTRAGARPTVVTMGGRDAEAEPAAPLDRLTAMLATVVTLLLPEGVRFGATLAVAQATVVAVEQDVQVRDRYGRLLAYPWLADGLDGQRDDCARGLRAAVDRAAEPALGCEPRPLKPDQHQVGGVRMSISNGRASDEAAIQELVEDWARAVRAKDLKGILANHSPEMLMFDVPPPLASKGIDAYRKTWDLFFSWSDDPVAFDFNEMAVTAGNDVAYVTALMRCAGTETNGERIKLEFRLTIGLRKIGGQWTVMHEHHSIPAS
jgi:uncharacterized protein (TIGR02246 family)